MSALVLVVFVLVTSCAAAVSRAPRAASDAEIRAILAERASHTADPGRLRAHVRDDVEIVDEKGVVSRGPDGLLPAYAAAPAIVQLSERVDDLHTRAIGDAVVATYRRQAHLVLGGTPVDKEWRVTETFVRGASGWQTAAYQETVSLGVPLAHGADPARLDDYVGQYALFPGLVYKVRRAGDKLTFGATVEREIVPESPDAFVSAGDPNVEGFGYRVIFVREGGSVTRLRVVEFPGVEYEAKRVDDAKPAVAASAGADGADGVDGAVREAVTPLPPVLRAGATVIRWTQNGQHEVVRAGTNPIVCFRETPGEAEFDARCYHRDFMPLIYRWHELAAQGMAMRDAGKRIDAEVKAGKLALPKQPTAGYRVLGPARAYEAATGEITAEMDSWQSVHVPYASADQLGVADMSVLPEAAQKWEPYSMAVGTFWAHIMIEHPPRSPRP
jgi:hypothetical protein